MIIRRHRCNYNSQIQILHIGIHIYDKHVQRLNHQSPLSSHERLASCMTYDDQNLISSRNQMYNKYFFNNRPLDLSSNLLSLTFDNYQRFLKLFGGFLKLSW